MSKIIDPNSTGKVRNRLRRQIALSLRELAQRAQVDEETRDLVAFIVLALDEIAQGIDKSVTAWEKRDYWVKADRFRLEWEWAGQVAEKLRQALLNDAWGDIPPLLAQIGGHFADIKISPRHRMGRPWTGAYRHLKEKAGQK